MKILVTGSNGYIGSILVPQLLNLGHSVIAVDNLMYNNVSLLDCCANKNFEMIRGDVRNQELMKELVPKVDAIIPLACLVGAPLCDKDPFTATAVNSEAVKFLNDIKSKNQILVYPCSNSGYGIGQEGIHCDESSPLKPVSLYGKLKVEAETHLLDGGQAVCFRLATVFGTSPRMRLDLLVNEFTYKAVNDGYIVLFESHFKRNYLHVRDAANAFVHVLDNYDSMVGETYNVGLSEANISKMELCQKIKEYVPNFTIVESEIGVDQDKRNYIVSNQKIERTGFKTQHSLDDGIKELLKGFQILKRNQYSNI